MNFVNYRIVLIYEKKFEFFFSKGEAQRPLSLSHFRELYGPASVVPM